MDLGNFETWLRSEGKSLGTIVNYLGAIRRAVEAIGENQITTERLDLYAADLRSGQPRGNFRSAWRSLVHFEALQGRDLANVSSGQLGRPPHSFSRAVKLEDCAIAYLARTIPLKSLSSTDGLALRWTDVEFVSPSDAIIRDPPARTRYHVHRRVLDVLLSWARSDGQAVGALVPDKRDGRTWMPPEELQTRIDAVEGHAPTDPVAAFILSLPPPRAEPWTPRPRLPVDPSLRTT